MARWGSASVASLLAGGVDLRPKIFIWLDFPSGAEYAWNGHFNIPITPVGETGTWTWEPAYDFLSTSEVTHSVEPGSRKFQVRISSASDELKGKVREKIFGREVGCWRGWGTANGDAIVGGEIVPAWRGQMDAVSINRREVVLEGEKSVILMTNVTPSFRTYQDHVSRYSGDKFYRRTASGVDTSAQGLNPAYRMPLD